MTVFAVLRMLLRQSVAGFRVLAAFTLVLGLGYPLLVTVVAQSTMGWQADGSLVTAQGERTRDPREAVGSELIGQAVADPSLFVPRPSVAGDGYDPLSTGGSNLGPNNPELVAAITQRRAEIAAREGVDPGDVPADAVTASASGLDPDISPAYAALQVPRVAAANGLTESQVRDLVAAHTEGRGLGVLGEPRVTVLTLNIAVRQLAGS